MSYRAVQEFIAKAWERYHREGGKGFSEGFQKVLDQITQAFKAVYKSLTGKELTPELRKMFDEILGKETSPNPNSKGEGTGTTTEVKEPIKGEADKNIQPTSEGKKEKPTQVTENQTPPPNKTEPIVEEGGEGGKNKALATRLVESKNIPSEAKKAIS